MCICKICKSSGKQGEIFVIKDFESIDDAICAKCIQPERLNPEDENVIWSSILDEYPYQPFIFDSPNSEHK